MTMYTYAQNGEDVILQRVFRHIEHGFYVDVGAQHPTIDSVTKAFYELGWHGINVEPASTYLTLLRQDRPRDLNIGIVVSNASGLATFYRIPDSGLSTTQAEYADNAKQTHGFAVHQELLPSLTLSQILACAERDEIHFLKIDVEGGEKAVIQGLDLNRDRPWVIVVEATAPDSTCENHHEWEPLLLTQGYEFVFADGLNRYFLASEHSELRDGFRTPPNIFDEAVPHALVRIARQLESALGRAPSCSPRNATEHFQAIENQIAAMITRGCAIQAELASCRAEHAELHWRFESLRRSLSWRLTSPFREARRAVSKASGLLGLLRPTQAAQPSRGKTPLLGRSGWIRNQLRSVEKKFRRFRRRFSMKTARREYSTIAVPLSERTREIHRDLVNAISESQNATDTRNRQAA